MEDKQILLDRRPLVLILCYQLLIEAQIKRSQAPPLWSGIIVEQALENNKLKANVQK